MPNEWVMFVKQYAKENNISYGCAIAEAGPAYRKMKAEKKNKEEPSAKQKESFNFLKNIASIASKKPTTLEEADYEFDKDNYGRTMNMNYDRAYNNRKRVIDLFENHKGIYKNSSITGGKDATEIYNNMVSYFPNDSFTKLLGKKLKLI